MNQEHISFDGLHLFYTANSELHTQSLDIALRGPRLRSDIIKRLEHRCASEVGRCFAVAVNSATDALGLALIAGGVGPGDEVIVPAFTFAATAMSVVSIGAHPVLADVDPVHLRLDSRSAEAAISSRTKAIIYVQLFGQCEFSRTLESICAARRILLIEDAAQAWGATASGRRAGTLGIESVFSFDCSKVVPGLTTGGMVLCDDEKIAERLRRLRCHGYDAAQEDFLEAGRNSQMSSVNAAWLLAALDKAPEWQNARRDVAVAYDRALATANTVTALTPSSTVGANHHKYVIRFASPSQRESARLILAGKMIPTKVHYSRALCDYSAFATLRSTGGCQQARSAAATVLSLPIHPYLTAEHRSAITSVLEQIA